jgi:hypothetical protein
MHSDFNLLWIILRVGTSVCAPFDATPQLLHKLLYFGSLHNCSILRNLCKISYKSFSNKHPNEMYNLFIYSDVLKENMLLSGSSINSLTIILKQYLKKMVMIQHDLGKNWRIMEILEIV